MVGREKEGRGVMIDDVMMDFFCIAALLFMAGAAMVLAKEESTAWRMNCSFDEAIMDSSRQGLGLY